MAGQDHLACSLRAGTGPGCLAAKRVGSASACAPLLAWIELAGGGIAGLGLALAVSCFILFARQRTTIMPSGHPSRLVLDGPYRFTRNPMYLALVLSYIGLCLQLGLLWAVALLPLPWLALQRYVILFEEARLRSEFGRHYSAYCARAALAVILDRR